MGFNLGRFLNNAAKSAGHAVNSAVHTVDKVTGDISKEIHKLPIAGPLFLEVADLANAPYTLGYKAMVAAVEGQRIDRAIMNDLKGKLHEVQDVGPYVQTIIAMVPAVGPAVSGGLSMAIALSSGKRIDDAMIAFAAGAIPGGAIAKMAFDAGKNIIQSGGKNLSNIGSLLLTSAMTGLNVKLPPDVLSAAGKLLNQSAAITADIASGKRVDKTLLAHADALTADALSMAKLPASATSAIKTGLTTGIALAQGKKIQDVMLNTVTSSGFLNNVASIGATAIAGSPVLQNAANLVKEGSRGFNTAVGAMKHAASSVELTAIRNSLSALDKKGFDIGLSVKVGMTTSAAPKNLSPAAQAGFYVNSGVVSAPPEVKTMVIQKVATVPQVKAGAVVSAKAIINADTWWRKVLRAIGLGK